MEPRLGGAIVIFRKILGHLGLTAVILLSPPPLSRADDFFAGKSITISTFTPPGGSYDTYARLLARHIGRFIPGRPTVIVLNQPGAGGLVALNYAGKVAPRDGTFLTLVGVGLLLQEATGGQGMQVSLRDFRWIGNFSKVTNAIVTEKTSRTKNHLRCDEAGGAARLGRHRLDRCAASGGFQRAAWNAVQSVFRLCREQGNPVGDGARRS